MVSSRRPLHAPWVDPRVEFVAIDFLAPVEEIIAQLKPICAPVTHAYFASYVHDDDFHILGDKEVPQFRNSMDVVDTVCPVLQRVSLQTGGKYYGVHLGPVKVPLDESFPQYDDQGYNFYYNQEDYLREVQTRRRCWSYNVIRPSAINGYAPHANGMSEALTVAIYMLICRELAQPATFLGNEYFWNSIDDNSYAPSFGGSDGLGFDAGPLQGPGAPEPNFETAKRQAKTLRKEIDMLEWAKDKQEVWDSGKAEACSWGTWGFFDGATGKPRLTFSSINRQGSMTFRSFENARVLPSHKALTGRK
ncbi:uncharacterized protein BO97DRAFT_456709 [Aspergillus homomorphus CBS 101889]|uniref:PRISE-like Rossmann-fold domain-containing protein n=1 Tax=Aspergillus homomorphus (strain CBS 101889) TaxID=1450537 RepID=A0A395HQB5_ASPHC|nr:hypothetical protein BO97DRAFT_456709 [Aspergillus homomorphus CBS 101889]RAL10142.1 hypothetical protein BO97DRAFT_456709 [Aspergillus homomorphus CBS 101889]